MTEGSGPATIEIRLERVAQLFSMLDPYPFRERDLDAGAEEHLVGWARELPRDRDIQIIVHLPDDEARTAEALGIGEALHNFFRYRGEVITRDLKEMFRIGRLALAIGLVVLGTCLILANIVGAVLVSSEFGRFVREGLVIVGWVANWRPLEIFLYDWWPLVRRRRLFARLASARVIIKGEARAARRPA